MDKETTKIARIFASKIKKKYNPEKFLLFGSRARGDNFKTSDFDFIIVSKKFYNTGFLERGIDLYDYWNNKYSADFICYTPEEFKIKAKEHGIVRQAVKEGVEL